MSARANAGAGEQAVAPFRVGLLGHGTVGSAFARLLDERAEEIERFNGRRPVISGVLTRSRGNFEEILDGAHLLVELMGGLEPAREHLLAAMRAGKDVVSANKQLLSQHGEELFETARAHGVKLRFEAAVAGVVPVVRVLEESLSATPIERIHGIVNGTTNFILTEMAHGSSYAEALADAQRRGFAEADPSDDVSGRDAPAKMAILARLPAPPLQLPLVEDVQSAFYVHLEMADRPGVLAAVTKVLGDHAVSLKSVVQRGLGENARLVMVTHPVLESRLRAALAQVGNFDFMRSEPRAIRVIEE